MNSGCELQRQQLLSSALERIESHKDDEFDYELIDLFRMIPTYPVSLYFHRDEILKKQASCAQYRAEVLFEAERQILYMYRDIHLFLCHWGLQLHDQLLLGW